jgi:hypothetical protein
MSINHISDVILFANDTNALLTYYSCNTFKQKLNQAPPYLNGFMPFSRF